MDSVNNRQALTTARYIEASKSKNTFVPPLPYIGAEGPRADRYAHRVHARLDGLGHGPDTGRPRGDGAGVVHVANRLGGDLVPANYRGRGSGSVEYYLDGLPYVAVGPDSTAVDPSIFALSLLERVEIEPWPGVLKVYLYSRRYDRVAPRSLIGLSRGTNSLTSFQAQLEKRSVNKVSFGIAGDYYNSSRLGGSSSTFYLSTQAWAQVSYVPSPRYGIVAQYVTVVAQAAGRAIVHDRQHRARNGGRTERPLPARFPAKARRWRGTRGGLHGGAHSFRQRLGEHHQPGDLVVHRERDMAHADAECHGLGGIPNALDERRPRSNGGMDPIGANRDQRQRRLPTA